MQNSMVLRIREKRLTAYMTMLMMIFFMNVIHATAQEADYYQMEVGGGVGIWNYLGDFNGNLMKGFQPQGSVMLKYLPDEHMAFKFDASIGKMKGDYNLLSSNNFFPTLKYNFSTTAYDFSLMYEYNFWRHGMSGDYRHLYRLVPYIAIGAGCSYFKGKGEETSIDDGEVTNENFSDFAFSFPVGIGVKYKMAERLNMGFEYIFHISTSDKIDGVKDPYQIKSSGLFKNTDCFGQFKLYFTYSFMAKCRQCNN